MAQNTTTYSVTAPGFAGLNTQDAPVDMDSKFALEANNCIIDKFGRVGSRKGWTTTHTTLAALGTANVESIGELVQQGGTRTIVCAGNGKLFKKSGSTLIELTYGGGGVAPTITANKWQMVCLTDSLTMFQEGYDPLIYDIALSTTTYRRLSEHPTYSGTAPKANCAIAAYGRIWAARSDTDKDTLQWTDSLTHQKWSGGSAGSLDLRSVWPQGGDEIVALAAHNNNLIIFGSRQVLIYTGAKDPSTMTLSDAIGNSGCVGRDTVQNTPTDIVFLSSGGLRSLARTIQEKSAPLNTASRMVNDDVLTYLGNEATGATIRSVYSPPDQFYLLTFGTSSTTFCFDMRTQMEDGSYRVTTWSSINPLCYCYSDGDRTLYIGKPGYIGKYYGYSDNGSQYRMSYYTPWLDFGDPVRTSILKKISMTMFGTVNQSVVYKWGFDYKSATRAATVTISDTTTPAEYGIAEYGIAEFSQNLIVKSIGMNVGGVGKVVQMGFECQVTGYPLSVQRIDIYTKDGAYK